MPPNPHASKNRVLQFAVALLPKQSFAASLKFRLCAESYYFESVLKMFSLLLAELDCIRCSACWGGVRVAQ
eukprot:5644869-Amphidinium_carterae.1